MANSMNNNRQYTEADILRIKRLSTPRSTQLQTNILNITQELPQYTDNNDIATVYNLSAFLEKVRLKKISFWNGFKPYAATLAAGFAVIALSSTLWLPTQNDLVVIEDYSELTVEQLAEEIAWQDLMLLQDELAFAGL